MKMGNVVAVLGLRRIAEKRKGRGLERDSWSGRNVVVVARMGTLWERRRYSNTCMVLSHPLSSQYSILYLLVMQRWSFPE